jgi:Protein of unknown function (DUF1045)
MQNTVYDIVLLPENRLAELAIGTSQTLASLGTHFTLQKDTYVPHLSLYMVRISQEQLPQVIACLQHMAARSALVHATATSYNVGKGFGAGYIDPQYEKTAQLTALQAQVLQLVEPLRSGHLPGHEQKLQNASGVKKQNLETYGYDAIGELFRPHMTLTRFTREIALPVDLLPQVVEFSGTFNAVGLYEMGQHGTCVKQVFAADLTA